MYRGHGPSPFPPESTAGEAAFSRACFSCRGLVKDMCCGHYSSNVTAMLGLKNQEHDGIAAQGRVPPSHLAAVPEGLPTRCLMLRTVSVLLP